MKFYKSYLFAALLNLLIPGLGHVFWKEITFGLFIYLITLTALVLFVVSLFVDLPVLGLILMFSLPVIFYFFTFVDLFRTVKKKQGGMVSSIVKPLIFLLVGLVYQLLAPIAPGNFALRNLPEIYTVNTNALNPFFSEGDVVKASALSYSVNLFFLERPVLHSLPDRYEIVRFYDNSDFGHTGMVLGLPGEKIEICDGILLVDYVPQLGGTGAEMRYLHDWPLTSVEGYSILVATLKLGAIDKIYEVPLTKLVGKVSRLW